MLEPRLFGRKEVFAIDVVSFNLKELLGDMQIWICGERVGHGHGVFVPTFASKLRSFVNIHQSPSGYLKENIKDFHGIEDDRVFQMLNQVVTTGEPFNEIRVREVEGYHLMHSLDDVVDGWHIFVVDDRVLKRIIWQAVSPLCPPHHRDHVWSTTLPAKEFIKIINDFADYVGWGEKRGRSTQSTP